MMNSKHQASGFTIIEIMVAMAMTSVLLLGTATMFSSAHRGGQVQTTVSDMSATGRFVLDALSRDLRMAGYRDSNWSVGAIDDVLDSDERAAAVGGDTVTVQYEAARDCNFAPTLGGTATNQYGVIAGVLNCNGQPLVDGIEQMQVYFGEDLTGDGTPNRFLSPDTAGLSIDRVVSIRVHVLVVSNAVAISAVPQPFFFDNQLRDAIDDGQLRREYSVTVALRNPI
jgi:type IV pilus assembly protein PilW